MKLFCCCESFDSSRENSNILIRPNNFGTVPKLFIITKSNKLYLNTSAVLSYKMFYMLQPAPANRIKSLIELAAKAKKSFQQKLLAFFFNGLLYISTNCGNKRCAGKTKGQRNKKRRVDGQAGRQANPQSFQVYVLWLNFY